MYVTIRTLLCGLLYLMERAKDGMLKIHLSTRTMYNTMEPYCSVLTESLGSSVSLKYDVGSLYIIEYKPHICLY